MKRSYYFKPMLRIGLLVLVFVSLSSKCPQQGDCSHQGDEVNQAAELIRQHAIKQNPAFRNQRVQFRGTKDGGDGVCACIQVCNSQGENCTACSCSPSGCGSC